MQKERKIIVSIDGGGIRGILPLLFLDHIEKLFANGDAAFSLAAHIDLIAGTSAGAIILGGIANKKDKNYVFPISKMLDLYTTRGAQLFNLSAPGDSASEGLKLLLKRSFAGIRLQDLSSDFLFVSYDKLSQKPFLFSSDNNTLQNTPLSLALAACSAVPEFFKPVILDNHQLIDGIFTAKNPAYLAYEYVEKNYRDSNLDMLFLSFGTGQLSGKYYDAMEEQADFVHHKLLAIAQKNEHFHYFRIQPPLLYARPEMEDASKENIRALLQDGKDFIINNKSIFDEIVAWH